MNGNNTLINCYESINNDLFLKVLCKFKEFIPCDYYNVHQYFKVKLKFK